MKPTFLTGKIESFHGYGLNCECPFLRHDLMVRDFEKLIASHPGEDNFTVELIHTDGTFCAIS